MLPMASVHVCDHIMQLNYWTRKSKTLVLNYTLIATAYADAETAHALVIGNTCVLQNIIVSSFSNKIDMQGKGLVHVNSC